MDVFLYEKALIWYYFQNSEMHFCFTVSEMTTCRPVEKRDLCTCPFQGLPRLARPGREELNPSSDSAHHLSSLVRSAFPSHCSCPCPINVFLTLMFAFKILVFLWESPKFQMNLPWDVWITLSLFPVASFVAGCFTSRSSVHTARVPLPSGGCIQTDSGTASEVWEPSHRCVHC